MHNHWVKSLILLSPTYCLWKTGSVASCDRRHES